MFINLILFFVHHGKCNLMIGAEALTICFIQARTGCQAKSKNGSFIARICFKLKSYLFLVRGFSYIFYWRIDIDFFN